MRGPWLLQTWVGREAAPQCFAFLASTNSSFVHCDFSNRLEHDQKLHNSQQKFMLISNTPAKDFIFTFSSGIKRGS
jgi:hypothetical protein